MFVKIRKICLDSIKQINRHYKDSKKDIARNNAILLMSISACAVITIGILLIVTPFLISTWHITLWHWFFIPTFISFGLIGRYEYNHKVDSYQIIHGTVLIFMGILMFLVLEINVVAYPDSVAALVAIAMVALPMIFVIPFHEAVIFLVISYLIFLQMNYNYAAESIMSENLFNVTAGMAVGIAVSFINTNLRAQDNKNKQEIVRLSNQDELTGIWNKSTAEKNCFTYLDMHKQEPCALIVIDVDFFKTVNDTFGHLAGDEVLSIFGESMNKVFRNTDILGRIGGDEFLVLMKNVDNAEIVSLKMQTLAAMFHQEVFEKLHAKVTCSYGAILKDKSAIAYFPLFEMADKIMYRAKKNGKNQGEVLSVKDYKRLISTKKIMLIVDDEEINRGILKTVFQQEYEIIEAQDGQEAEDIIAKHHSIIDIMLLDIIMPKVDGFQVLEWLNESGYIKTLPTIAISADDETELQALELGVSDMISKPFVDEVLKKRVENVMGKREA